MTYQMDHADMAYLIAHGMLADAANQRENLSMASQSDSISAARMHALSHRPALMTTAQE
ncbi:hypothetical protein HBH56_084120 [Parastagonospora nodorum]|uniref:Uncharacterized protein n=1 Tax=Phaeosphaeria nodorum (strain SN15 / ATCC MYA-4574 / FGSC 10173) TaxID=321614 RepID=A0A7U2I035_PHANO|nr:hypothetical protein HBH56_084120 [Parastagonospora nodorum]QRC96794.1 hypothetical protein JI435_409630 [Parastagonospora nodorum SN15]KAH3930099.1 hypothetical protein HBH54_117700 [Parastagonospora nodorum]KAH3955318.1 hypothetical protein HBH53_006850 [Parastagonospora nodorum]KAH3982104.1 hypothetical protein HBH52_079820 [Parastagonospora nodorum]